MAGYSALPALDIQSFNPLATAEGVQDYQLRAAQLPGQIQESQDEASVRHTQFQNGSLANAAAQVQALDPDQRSAAWDQKMSDLAEKGVPQARQYIGRYSDERAGSVQSIFSGQAGQKANAAAQQNVQANPQMVQQLMLQPPEQRQKSIQNLNQAITAIGRVNNSDDLNSEINLLKQSGIAFDPKQVPGLDLTRTDSRGYTDNYRALYTYLQNQIPLRDAMIQAEQNQALGITPQDKVEKVGDNLYNYTKGQWVTPLPKHQFEGIEKTGGQPVDYEETQGKVTPFTDGGSPGSPSGSAAYSGVAAKLNQDESGNNPNAQSRTSTAGGVGQQTDKTWTGTVRQTLPQLAGLSDQQILAMRGLPGFNTDMTVALAQKNAQVLQTNNLPVNGSTIAIMHKLGAPDGQRVLAASPDTTLDKVIKAPGAMDPKSNPQFYGPDGKTPLTVGQYEHGIMQKFGVDPINTGTGDKPSWMGNGKSGDKFNNPVQLNYTDKSGNPVQVLAQQDKNSGQWVSADQNRTPINAPNNDITISPATMGGGRNAMMVTRALTDAKDAATDIANLARMPLSANAGYFGLRTSHGDGSLTGSALDVLANGELSSSESRQMNKVMVGMGKALAGLETGGTAGAGGKALMDQYEKLAIQPGDKPLDAMVSLAQMRQNSTNAIEANMANGFTTSIQRKQFQETSDAIKKAVPWTVGDVLDYQQAAHKNKSLTFSDFAAQRHLGGGGNNQSPQDQQAMAWAKANPNDPRSAKILQHLGTQ